MQNQGEFREVEGDVIITDPDRYREANGQPVVTGYRMGGGECSPTDLDCLAKKSIDPNGGVNYWLKMATIGMDRGHLFNPQSPMSSSLSVKQELARGKHEFRRAPRAAFELFVKFLGNRNPVDYRQAERFMV